jgi:hypothetical protein
MDDISALSKSAQDHLRDFLWAESDRFQYLDGDFTFATVPALSTLSNLHPPWPMSSVLLVG